MKGFVWASEHSKTLGITFTNDVNKRIKLNLKHKIEIIVVNDGSSDKTGKILAKVKYVKLINKPENQGYGAALKTGIKHSKGEWILITDADGTYPIKDIPRLINNYSNYEIVRR